MPPNAATPTSTARPAEFFVREEDEPHAVRKVEIMKKDPEVSAQHTASAPTVAPVLAALLAHSAPPSLHSLAL